MLTIRDNIIIGNFINHIFEPLIQDLEDSEPPYMLRNTGDIL